MTALQKVALAVVGVAMATTILLPNRQTPQVIQATTGLVSGTLNAAEGQG